MNQQEPRRPSKADAMRQKRLATARKKRKQRQLILSAAAVLTVVILLVAACMIFLFLRRDHTEDNTPGGTAQSTQFEAPASGDTSGSTQTTTTVQTTQTGVTSQTTATTPETDVTNATEVPPSSGDTLQSPIFTYTENGQIAGTPTSYGNMTLQIEGVSVGADIYRISYENYVPRWYESLRERAVRDYSTEEGGGTSWFNLVFSGVDHDTRLALRVNGSRISYGAETGMPANTGAVNFSLNGIALGARSDQVVSTFGTPTAQTAGELSYAFENGALLSFRLTDGAVSQIRLTWVAFTETN